MGKSFDIYLNDHLDQKQTVSVINLRNHSYVLRIVQLKRSLQNIALTKGRMFAIMRDAYLSNAKLLFFRFA